MTAWMMMGDWAPMPMNVRGKKPELDAADVVWPAISDGKHWDVEVLEPQLAINPKAQPYLDRLMDRERKHFDMIVMDDVFPQLPNDPSVLEGTSVDDAKVKAMYDEMKAGVKRHGGVMTEAPVNPDRAKLDAFIDNVIKKVHGSHT